MPKIDKLLKKSDVVIDGLCSWEECLLLKKRYGSSIKVVAIAAPRETRIRRLQKRKGRPLTRSEAMQRDMVEIVNSKRAGPIAIADYTLTNDGTLKQLEVKAVKLQF